ncbi:MlaD family protein [Vreelandella massiliensis]|uniref:MlaD family protein n=1 Tax=Vreelandella massiliensis TaxID=1816686 RepID=UPI00096AA9CE|nr:MlaD family protein [Halomonas massiliensis]MYL24110.1 MCE family protein [Halomonas alkaliantarctica]
METRAHHVVIGLFTLLTLTAAVLFSLWMTKASLEREYQHVEVVFHRAVSGLSVGSRVEYSGIDVGDVVNMRLNPEDPREVLALIRVEAGVPIKEDTRARLGLANITGSMTLQLYGGTPESPLLTSSDGSPPQILAEPSPLYSLLSDGEAIVSNASQLLSNLNTLFEEESTERISRIIANVESISAGLAGQQQQFERSMQAFSGLTQEARATLESLNSLNQEANRLLTNEGNELVVSSTRAADSLNQVSQRLSVLIETNAPTLETTLESAAAGAQSLAPALDELRKTLNNINRVTRRLEENPQEFLFGGETVQEFRP